MTEFKLVSLRMFQKSWKMCLNQTSKGSGKALVMATNEAKWQSIVETDLKLFSKHSYRLM